MASSLVNLVGHGSLIQSVLIERVVDDRSCAWGSKNTNKLSLKAKTLAAQFLPQWSSDQLTSHTWGKFAQHYFQISSIRTIFYSFQIGHVKHFRHTVQHTPFHTLTIHRKGELQQIFLKCASLPN